jgi:triosephosphate isomerase
LALRFLPAQPESRLGASALHASVPKFLRDVLKRPMLTLPFFRAADCSDKFTNGALVTPQNCNFTGCGAYTGEMSVEQMKDLGIKQVRYLCAGRALFGVQPK